MNESLSGRQFRALLLTAGTAPIFTGTCGLSWAMVLPASLLACGVVSGMYALVPGAPAKLLRAVFAAALLVLTVWAGKRTAPAFPETARSAPAACLILALAALAAGRGAAVLGRCAGVLIWILAGLYGVVLAFGFTQINTEWLRPEWNWRDLPKAALLLLPAAALPLRGRTEGKKGSGLSLLTLAALAVSASMITGASLSPVLAREPMSFLTLARSVSILGVIQRFEALISAALLMSGFCLCALLYGSLREEFLHLFGERRGRRGYLAAVASSLAISCLTGQF